jgi:hypothetical protein
MIDLSSCFSSQESLLLDEVRRREGALAETAVREIHSTFERMEGILVNIARALDYCPVIQSSETIGGRTRNVESLIEGLCTSDPAALDFILPTRVVLGQSLLHAKINFFKAIRYVLEEHGGADGLLAPLGDVIADALYCKLSEELLINCIANTANPAALRRRAARTLIPIWEQRRWVPLEDFTRLLLSAWKARCRVQEVFGTLVGFHEVQSLLRAECEPRFLDFFNRDVGTADEREALREFLFGLSYEDLQKLGDYMAENGIRNVGPGDVLRILGHTPYHTPATHWTAENVYLSYRRRRIRADYRVLSAVPGPRKTAEGYLMEYHLLQAQ